MAQNAPNVRRLAQYRPFENGGLGLRAVLSDLVLAALAIKQGRCDSVFALQQAFADLWHLEVEIDELRATLDDLGARAEIEKDGKAYSLSVATAERLAARAAESQATETRAFREWEAAARLAYPSLTDDELGCLGDDLRKWLHEIITRHGADAALILYPEQERATRFLDGLGTRGFDGLSECDQQMADIREDVLLTFVRHPTADQRRFLAGLLNTSFYTCVLTIDPEARQLVQEQMRGQRIYLDTNFLYAVLGASSPEEVYSARRLMQMCRDLGFQLAITPWTADELRTSIARSRREIEQQQAFVRPELAEMMLRLSGDKGFNRLFWQTYLTDKTNPTDVFDRLEHFDTELEKFGIDLVTAGCDRVEKQGQRVLDYTSLLNSVRWGENREWIVLEHDAKMRLLIEQLRGAGNLRVSNARYWFLTYDGKLPTFAEKVPDNGDAVPELPFCISPSTWVQIVRALTPRTEDYDQTVVDLLTSPYVGYRQAASQVAVQNVVGRMDHLDDASPETALAVLADTAKVREIESAVASEDDDSIQKIVQFAFSEKARELTDAVKASEARAASAEERIDRLEQSHMEAQRAADEAAAERQARWETEREELKGLIAGVRGERDSAQSVANKAQDQFRDLQEMSQRAATERRRRWRVGTALALVLIGLAVAVDLPVSAFANRWEIAAAVTVGCAVGLVGVRQLFPQFLSNEAWIGVVGVVATIAFGIAVANPASSPTSGSAGGTSTQSSR